MKKKNIIIVAVFFFSLFFFSYSAKGVTTEGTFTPISLDLTVENPVPANGSVNVELNVTLNIDVSSAQGYLMNLSWYENTTGNWSLVQQNLSVNNGTYSYVFVNASNYSTNYWWKVSVNDTESNWNNKTFCFSTLSFIPDIVISNVYPSDNSSNIPVQPTLYISINHTFGKDMNISWYFGINLGDENILLGTTVNVSNGTYSMVCYPASDHVTTYYWKVCINDGDGYWRNETCSFTTEYVSGGFMILKDTSIFGIIGVIGVIGFLGAYVFNKKRKKNKTNI